MDIDNNQNSESSENSDNEHVIDLGDFDYESSSDDPITIEREMANQPLWTKKIITIIRGIKILLYIVFLCLFAIYSGTIYSLQDYDFPTNLIKVLWGTNTALVFLNMIIICIDFLFDFNCIGRNSRVAYASNIIKFIVFFTFYGMAVLALVLFFSPLKERIRTFFLIMIIYYGIEFGWVIMLFILYIVMCKFGYGISFSGLMINLMSTVPFRTGAYDEELNKLKEYTLVRQDSMISLHDDNDKEITDLYQEKKCIICHEKYENKDVVRYLECKHFYHKDCCDDWLKVNKSCPTCRQTITFQ